MRNKHPGPCYRCDKTVPAGAGYFERHAGGWRVQHVECCHKAQRERAAFQPSELLCSECRAPLGIMAEPGMVGTCSRCVKRPTVTTSDCPACSVGNPGVYLKDGRMVCPHRPESQS